MAGLYFDFHLPLGLKQLVEKTYGLKNPEQVSGVVGHEYSLRQWFSQPRVSTDSTTEVVTINFRLPLSVSEISFEVTRQSNRIEVWYQDRSNNWRPVLDTNRYPLEVTLTGEDWYTYSDRVYPIVAKSIQIRATRVPSREMGDYPYPIGLKNVLIKRNVQERNQGVQYLEEEEDSLGNVISKYIRDWDASLAIDNKSLTYWKSSPQPDPSAVVSLYLDVRDFQNDAQVIDKIYIDPVYTGQLLNLYYSSDDTVGVRRLSPITIMPLKNLNTEWRLGEGRRDLRGRDTSIYEFSGGWGTFTHQPFWFGCEWTPDFTIHTGPSTDPLFFNVKGPEEKYSPSISYNVGSKSFDLEFFGGARTYRFSARCRTEFVANEVLRIVAGWHYSPDPYVFIRVEKTTGEVLAEYEGEVDLPDEFTLDSSVTIEGIRGLLTSYIVKSEDYRKSSSKFLENPSLYVDPEPTLPDNNGNLPSSSLDDALYAVEWTQQEHGRGGTDFSFFTEKKWTPFWRDYVVEKGLHFLPRATPMKYLKLEFTRLTPEPYPVYESGIEVQYKTFPISVQQTATLGSNLYVGKGVGGLFNSANYNGIKSINWFNPRSVAEAVKNVFGVRYEPVAISTGTGETSATLPHPQQDSGISMNYRLEWGVRNIYRRRELDPYILSQNKYETIIRAEGLMKISPYTNIPWEEIYEVNRRAFQTENSPGALPLKGSDYWIFPGQTLQIPSSVMNRLTDTSTVTDFYANDVIRTRFTTTSVHRYETRTVKRDVGVAYFAGVREVTPMIATHINSQDTAVIKFDQYLAQDWELSDIHVYPNLALGRVDGEEIGRFSNMVNSMSYYTRANLKFHDSGLFSSNPMWLDDTTLSPDTQFFPSNFEGATWSDLFATWEDETNTWGAERSQVQITIDSSRQYRDRKAIRFKRAEGAGEAGVRVLQSYNLPKNSLTRIGVTAFRLHETTNEPLLRLVRKSDGVIIHSQVIQVNRGSWNEVKSDFFEVPTEDEYYAEFVLTGDTEEEVYVSNLYTETAHVRYFVSTSPFFTDPIEVTELNYASSSNVVFENRIDHFYIMGAIVSDIAYAYGCEVRPDYLQ